MSRAHTELKQVRETAQTDAVAANVQLETKVRRIDDVTSQLKKLVKKRSSRSLIEGDIEQSMVLSNPEVVTDSVLILTPAKNAVPQLKQYFKNLQVNCSHSDFPSTQPLATWQWLLILCINWHAQFTLLEPMQMLEMLIEINVK